MGLPGCVIHPLGLINCRKPGMGVFSRTNRSVPHWDTVKPQRDVLAVARTITSAGRLLDVLPAFDGDFRVQVHFTINEGSAFSDGLAEFLHDLSARVVPWREALRTRFDLAISATSNGGLHRLKAPLLVMPHGAGHNRLVEVATGSRRVASGLSGRQLLHRGRPVPAAIALTHEEQIVRLRRACPPAVGRAVVTGDPCFDRIVANLALRDDYRHDLGLRGGQRLLVVTSTWGPHSLLARRGELLARWISELPVDSYRTALVLHPNIWARHGGERIEGWLADALNAGLMLLPPDEGWRAALIAADWVVGDHGAVTYYSAALGRPTLLAAFGDEELDPESPVASLGRTHPRLDPKRGLREQLRDLAPVPVQRNALGMRGQALENLSATMYDLMRLTPPSAKPRIRPLPPPVPRGRAVSALLVDGSVEGERIVLERYPAEAEHDLLDDPHLLVDDREVDRRLLESAAIIVRRAPAEEPEGWVRDTFSRHPGAMTAAVALDDSRCLVALADGGRFKVSGADVSVCASAIYVQMAAGRSIRKAMRVVTGEAEGLIEVTPPPAV